MPNVKDLRSARGPFGSHPAWLPERLTPELQKPRVGVSDSMAGAMAGSLVLVPIRCYGHHGPAVRRGLKTLRKIPSTTSAGS